MKALKQNQTEGSKREDKKKTNIKFNSAIFFQLGLVVALVASAWAMNLNIEEKTLIPNNPRGLTIEEPNFIMPVLEVPKIETPKIIAKLEPQPRQRVITSIVEVVPDDQPIIETKTIAPPSTPVVINPPVVATPAVVTTPKVNKTEGINSVEFVPIFPGCESAGDKNAQIACMNEKIARFVGSKFDTSVANNDTTGNQRITVQFKIDKNGNAVDIKALSKDKNLEKEAKRVISRLPEFTPGKMGDVAVDVMYMLPINFQID